MEKPLVVNCTRCTSIGLNETKAQVYDFNRRGCAALPAGQTVKREGGFNSQRKIVPMSNNQQSEKRKK